MSRSHWCWRLRGFSSYVTIVPHSIPIFVHSRPKRREVGDQSRQGLVLTHCR